ncbi:unnamed protein product, partial [Brugia timori]|uniref:Rab-GAP TBC domain-containing protein n=1 Tax=Brugia timori TaxID=42155 RepID=A0A0R3R899_9BILA
MTSLPDVEDDGAGPSSIELPTTPITLTPLVLQRTESSTSFLSRLSGRLRRSLHLPSNKREQFVKFLRDQTSLHIAFCLQETFTNYARIIIVNYDESYGSIKLIRQILHRNRPDEIKKMLRKTNWPIGHRIRANLWQEICKLNNPDFNAHKVSYESDGWEENVGHFPPKARFLQSSDTIHECYELNADGLKALHRLIRALDATIPTLNYAPLMQPILALCLHYMSEDDAYACVFWILKNHSNYMKCSALASKATGYTLLALIKVHKTAVYKTLKNWIGSSDENILASALQSWPKWIFCALPFEHLICVIDCYLYEGSKMPDDLTDKTCQERIDLFAERIVQSVKHQNISVT